MTTQAPAIPVGNWASEMRAVVSNFRKFMDEAKRPDVHTHRKCQLMASMHFYTTQITLSGMNVAMKSPEMTAPLRAVLQNVHQLQQEIIQQCDVETIYDRLCEADYRPNPLVLYLKMVLHDKKPEPDLAKVQQLLQNLQFEHVPGGRSNYAPGMPACILALYSPSRPLIVTATQDRYKAGGLPFASKTCWQALLKRLRDLCANNNEDILRDTEVLSHAFIRASGVKDQDCSVDLTRAEMKTFLANHSGQRRRVNLTVPMNSIVATWKPDGSYQASCLLDFYRFCTNRPEGNDGHSNFCFGSDCCAEWFAFIELAQPGQQILASAPLPASLKRTNPIPFNLQRVITGRIEKRSRSPRRDRDRVTGRDRGGSTGSGADRWRPPL